MAPKMNGEGKLQRSSWKAEAIRRGDLKISGPIPITEDTPLNEEEEKQYAAKHHIELPLQPPDSPKEQVAPPELPPPPVTNEESPPNADRVEVQPELQEQKHELRHKRSSSAIRETSEKQRQSDMVVSYNTPSPFPSLPDSPPQSTPRRKRKSGIRNVFRKMFGRKAKDEHFEENVPKHGHTKSDPGLYRKSQPELEKEIAVGGPRISELPVRELKPINPLGQHLPFPMNVNAPQEASPPHDYLTFENEPPTLHRRRATLPSLVVAQTDAQAFSASWGHAGDHEDTIPSPSQIGMAVSSPIYPRRRSQSAGALRELAKEQEGIKRRRSEEIKHWRESYRSASIYSSATPRPQTAQTIDTAIAEGTAPKEAIPDVPYSPLLPVEPVVVTPHDQDVSQVPVPVEDFNFGNLKNDFEDDEPKEVEPEIVEDPAPLPSVEGRLQQLEENMTTLQTSVRRISHRSNRQTIILENAPKGRRSRDRSISSGHTDRNFSRNSSLSSSKTLSTKQDPLDNPPSPPLAVAAPLSNITELPSPIDPSTIPLNPSPPQIPPAEQFAAVYTILKHERAARKSLEERVITLQREITELHAIVHRLVSGRPSYPTPSPDAIITNLTDEERVKTPNASRVRPSNLGIGFGSSEDVPGYRKERVVSRFSRSDTGSEAGEEGGEDGVGGYGGVDYSLQSSKEDVTSPDVWATPTEGGYGHGEFFARSAVDVGVDGGRGDMF